MIWNSIYSIESIRSSVYVRVASLCVKDRCVETYTAAACRHMTWQRQYIIIIMGVDDQTSVIHTTSWYWVLVVAVVAELKCAWDKGKRKRERESGWQLCRRRGATTIAANKLLFLLILKWVEFVFLFFIFSYQFYTNGAFDITWHLCCYFGSFFSTLTLSFAVVGRSGGGGGGGGRWFDAAVALAFNIV